MATSSFMGDWQVCEYVFSPSGEYCGSINQKRTLHKVSDGILVHQECRPNPDLSHPQMKAFDGAYDFHLVVEGGKRFYQGPDVVGQGLGFGPDHMVGSGIWPQFGYNFESYAMMYDPQTQLTGGLFFKGCELMAVICGVARLGGEPPPALELDYAPFGRDHWVGELQQWTASGQKLADTDVERHYHDGQIYTQDSFGRSTQWQGEARDGYELVVSEGSRGIARSYGCLRLTEVYGLQGGHEKTIEVSFNKGVPTILSLSLCYQDKTLVEGVSGRLKAKERGKDD